MIKNINRKIGETHVSLGEQVYKIIKDRIVNHDIKMNERIIDKTLADELFVSRSMVRQVLTTLVKEELVILIPRNGFYVREISKEEIADIYDIRKILEPYAVRQTIQRVSNKEIEKIEKEFHITKERNSLQNNVQKFIIIDIKFHSFIVDNCNNKQIAKILNRFENTINFYRTIDQNQNNRAEEMFFEHFEILKAIKSKNLELATQLMASHIENSKNIILNNYHKYTYGL